MGTCDASHFCPTLHSISLQGVWIYKGKKEDLKHGRQVHLKVQALLHGPRILINKQGMKIGGTKNMWSVCALKVIEGNKTLRIKPTHRLSTSLWQRSQEYIMGKG